MTPQSPHSVPSPDPVGAALRTHAGTVEAPDAGLAQRAIAGGVRRRRRTVAAGLAGTTAGVLAITGVAIGTHHLGAFPNQPLPAQTQTQTKTQTQTQTRDIAPDGETPVVGPIPTGTTPTGPTMTTTVYLTHQDKARADGAENTCEKVHPVQRTVARTSGVTRAALAELLTGPSPEELAQGYGGAFSDQTAGALRNVTIKDGTAYVDRADLRAIIPNASTSCGSAALLAQLTETTKAAAHVERVRLAIDGQPAILWGWLQRGCDEANDRCDPAPFGTLRYADLPGGAAVHPPYHVERTGTGDAARYTYVDAAGRVDLPREAGPTYVVRRAGGTTVLMGNGWFFTGGDMNADRQIYLIGADRTARLLDRGNLAAVSASADGRYVAYLTASAAAAGQDRYDALVIRDVATATIAGNEPVGGRYTLTWSGHTVVATPTDPRGTAVAWDVDRGARGDPGAVRGGYQADAISPDGTKGLGKVAAPWAAARPGEVPETRSLLEVGTVPNGPVRHLRAPLTTVQLLTGGGPTWEDATHVILQDMGAGGDGIALVRCDVVTGACEQAPDPQRLYSTR